MRFPKRYEIFKGQTNMAPLIDVILQLLVYFMLTSSFIMQPGIKINLPTAISTDSIEKNEVFISVSAEGIIFLGEKQVSPQQLEQFLRKFNETSKNIIIIIKGDVKTPHGKIVSVMDIARVAGISKIAIATMPVSEQ
ncbi:MAG: biopolymer transporter ExbD [Candidatus Omnitrophica bacterium]|nr:biopolymer transporter ExbD [Candidatus Omnitrophota bacterium]MCM8828828.1 biopolymer transporter ExbD [Candidatus Omnitrophota bacterium]